jgi:hypothetical protein
VRQQKPLTNAALPPHTYTLPPSCLHSTLVASWTTRRWTCSQHSIRWSRYCRTQRKCTKHRITASVSLCSLFNRVPMLINGLVCACAETKNQWARDDPAFAVVQVAFLVVTACAYGAVFQMSGLLNYLWLIANIALVHWLGCGVVVCTTCWWIANKYLRVHHEHR